jgi:hypothetical protein
MFLQSLPFLRYPRTFHLEGSRLQRGDSLADQVPLRKLAGRWAVLEEKIDGANSGLSFSSGAELLLQSRGHYLLEGAVARQFRPFVTWARSHEARLLERLEDRYIVFGEWAYAKHSVYYDQLPHLFHEFDIYDRLEEQFLSTARRRQLLQGLPVLSVPVLYEGPMPEKLDMLWALVGHSLAKSLKWKQAFEASVHREGLPLELTWSQTDASDLAEGLYIKVEEDGQVVERYKLVRHSFVQTILDSGSHHTRRPIVPNGLVEGVDLYAEQLAVSWEDLGLRTLHGLQALQEHAKTASRKSP